jgi:peptidyl-prolyl cis-trans isomerase A (cyclophilin A)
MHLRLSLFFVLICLLSASADTFENVIVQTSQGEFTLRLNSSKAPVTVKNFLAYVDQGLFSNARFHRTVTLAPDNQPQNKIKIEVIQAGLDPSMESKSLPAIPLERTNRTGLRHLDGTISMARDKPNTASSEFFICIGDQPELDFKGRRNPDGQGFAAFGQVVQGMDVVRRIHRAEANGQSLEPPILIQNIRRAR